MNEKQMANKNDQRLLEAAYYHESKGLMGSRPKDKEALIEFGEKVWNRFAQFKRRVMKSGVLISDIERIVYSKYGIMDSEADQYSSFISALTDLGARLRQQEEKKSEDLSNKQEEDEEG